MTQTIDLAEADRVLKARHRAMWALGDYPAVAGEIINTLGPVLVQAAGIRRGQRVLDVAAGTGNAAIPAALTGAEVVASDLTPELLAAGQEDATGRGADLEWRTADAEALPFADATFDTTVSCVGVMFAPHHQVAADELVRVTRPGGTIALINWTPEGFIGQLFATMKPFAPPPPPGAQPPPLWGDPDHVRGLLGGRVTELTLTRRVLHVDHFGTAEEFRDYFSTTYGPTIVAYQAIREDPDRLAALDAALIDLARRNDAGNGALDWEYLLVTARRR
ncbi:MAG TPA: methyltransferase domain-containing protein [Kineosporiaceae bacterium]|nr:methyltransferase domain-containing protein [Kineosporiaceae bacterium]